eukprot:gnl/Dysnectes_brevis/3446_a4355_1132.p1 GENE.gnl/Dysnectes_brevis/3446_a4355_1132~~gnl/Dysnectes_brevis/3446_a4355_1132.p1  ORF type:complete len:218 (+),score=15.88 gnl/Dysnectes_brevis/3446_a4355_1132:49-702(+)
MDVCKVILAGATAGYLGGSVSDILTGSKFKLIGFKAVFPSKSDCEPWYVHVFDGVIDALWDDIITPALNMSPSPLSLSGHLPWVLGGAICGVAETTLESAVDAHAASSRAHKFFSTFKSHVLPSIIRESVFHLIYEGGRTRASLANSLTLDGQYAITRVPSKLDNFIWAFAGGILAEKAASLFYPGDSKGESKPVKHGWRMAIHKPIYEYVFGSLSI